MKYFIKQNFYSLLSVFQDFIVLYVELIILYLKIFLFFDKDLYIIIYIKQKSKDQKD